MAPVLGAIQAVASFAVVMLERGDLGNRDLHLVLAGLSLVYGGSWLIAALVVADLALLRRTLSHSEFAGYLSAICITALVIGLLLPGTRAMLGYPATACAILLWGFIRRRRGGGVVGGRERARLRL